MGNTNVGITRVSGKGQIVLPSPLRKELGIRKADLFLVYGENGTIVLKKVEKMVKSFDEIAKPIRQVAKKTRFTRQDLARLIKEVRK